jgi:hypothetical protein
MHLASFFTQNLRANGRDGDRLDKLEMRIGFQ